MGGLNAVHIEDDLNGAYDLLGSLSERLVERDRYLASAKDRNLTGLGFVDELQAKRFAIKPHRADHVGHAKRDHRDAKRGLNGLCHNGTRGKKGDAKYRRHENNVLESARCFLPDLANFLRIADGGSPN